MTIIAMCVVVYIAQMFAFQPVTAQLALAPGFVWTEPWRLVTGAFAHGGVAHLLLNMYALWVVGTFAEQLLGRARFIALYFGSALGGAAMVLAYFRLFDFTYQGAVQATVGASGAVFGLFAALLVLGRRIKADIRGIAIVIAFNLVLSFTLAHISWQGHVGGMLTGAAMAAVYAYAPPKRRRLFAWLAIAGVLVLVAAVVVATVSPMALGA
ncbi:MAG: rhomboid family intramembrane serine protease [Bifidobacteriaceae bacterium]|jgi:membrane associated rhomboid family serine protease|nr:rhomboid family intramembrane serine protease [Bifidobacteriaceae bacterium]